MLLAPIHAVARVIGLLFFIIEYLPLCKCTAICSPICLPMPIGGASHAWLSEVKLRRAFVYKSYGGPVFLSFLGKHLGLQLLGHRVRCVIGRNCPFSKLVVPFHLPTSKARLPIILILISIGGYWVFFLFFLVVAILVDVKSWLSFVCVEHKLDENPLERRGHQLT